MRFSPQLKYLHDCFKADRQGSTLWNVFGKNIEHRITISGYEQLTNGVIPAVSIDTEKGVAVKNASKLYSKEKELIYGSFFITGTITAPDGKKRALCAPILLYPACIQEEDGQARLILDLKEKRMNTLLIQALCRNDERTTSVYEELLSYTTKQMDDAQMTQQLIDILEQNIPELNVVPAYRFPELEDEALLKKGAARKSLTLYSGGAVALIPRGVETRGILTELKEMQESEHLAQPVRSLLAENTLAPPPKRTALLSPMVPSILSRAQEKAVRAAAQTPLSMIIGPPGTGKSYTIASIALDHLCRKQTVLIVSRTNCAVDVVAKKLETILGATDCMVRAGRHAYLKKMKTSLDEMLHGILPQDPAAERSLSSIRNRIEKLNLKINTLSKAFEERSDWELRWGRFIAKQNGIEKSNFSSTLKKKYLNWRVSSQILHFDLLDQLDQLLSERISLSTTMIRKTNRSRIDEILKNKRSDLTTFLRAIRARRAGRREELFEQLDFRTLLEAYPLWLVNAADIHQVLPFQKELFDLVIVDEATQCDMASVMPAMQRAKRAIIVGDPKQLRHISFLSSRRQRAFEKKSRLTADERSVLDYRKNSLLDLASARIESQKNISFLNEHFRSLPPIIEFSNRNFYNDSLRIMTRLPRKPDHSPIELRLCETGKRSKNGENLIEAEKLIAELLQIIQEQESLNASTAQSIGIASPFRDQIDYIDRRLRKEVNSTTLLKHRVMTGTAHTFQGEERDIMLISMAVDKSSHPGSFHYLNRADQFNVLITRACVRQLIFSSIAPAQLDDGSIFGNYLQFLDQHDDQKTLKSTVKDRFIHEVESEFDHLGWTIWPAFIIAGVEVDLVIEKEGQTLGIDLIGYPGRFENAFTLQRYKIFRRAGLNIVPLPYASWCVRQSDCMEHIITAAAAQKKA